MTVVTEEIRRAFGARGRAAAKAQHLEGHAAEDFVEEFLEGAAAAHERIAAIVNSPEAEHRTAAALHLAVRTPTPADEAIAILAGLPAEASRMSGTRAGDTRFGLVLSSEPTAAPKASLNPSVVYERRAKEAAGYGQREHVQSINTASLTAAEIYERRSRSARH